MITRTVASVHLMSCSRILKRRSVRAKLEREGRIPKERRVGVSLFLLFFKSSDSVRNDYLKLSFRLHSNIS